jgi:ubiquitin thioesterase protein OTUB1
MAIAAGEVSCSPSVSPPARPLTRLAIAFTYFEALIRLGDMHKFDHEQVRLNSMGNLLDQIGYSRDIWIDFAEEAFELMHKLAASLADMDGAADDILLQSFNDINVSMAIITYFKVRAPSRASSASLTCPASR